MQLQPCSGCAYRCRAGAKEHTGEHVPECLKEARRKSKGQRADGKGREAGKSESATWGYTRCSGPTGIFHAGSLADSGTACLWAEPLGGGMARTGPSFPVGKRGREAAGLDHTPTHKLDAPVRAHHNNGNGIKRCKTLDGASETLCKIKISSILEEFGSLGSLGLEINPGPSPASAQCDPVHAVSKDEKKAYKRAPPAKQICCKCATVRTAPAGCKAGIEFCCRNSVGKHACAIKCIWTGCKRNICGSIIDSLDQFRSGLGAHAKECSCKHQSLTSVAQRLISLSIRLPFSAVRDADEQVWVQFAEDCLKCRAPEGMGDLIRRLYDQIKLTTLHPAWVESESTHFVRETFRVKTASEAALLVLRLEYGAVHWGRVDRSFHVERAAETLSGLRQTIQERMLSDETVKRKAPKDGEDLVGCTKITTTPVGQTITTTPTTAATPTNSKVTAVSTSTARGRGAFSVGSAPTAPAFSAEACLEGQEGCDEVQKKGDFVRTNAHKMKPICQFSVESRRLVQCHPSISDAAIAAGVHKGQMHKAIRLQSRLKGFFWQYMSAGSPPDSKIPSLIASCGGASQDTHGASGGVEGAQQVGPTCGRAAGGMENVQECRQHDKGEHESENTIMDENELPRRQQCGVCGGIDGHNKRTCPQLRNLLGQTLLGGGMPTVQEMPQSESAMRRSTPTILGFLGFRPPGSRDDCLL